MANYRVKLPRYTKYRSGGRISNTPNRHAHLFNVREIYPRWRAKIGAITGATRPVCHERAPYSVSASPQGLLVKTSRRLPAEAANIIGRDQVLRRNGQLLRQLINRLTNLGEQRQVLGALRLPRLQRRRGSRRQSKRYGVLTTSRSSNSTHPARALTTQPRV